MDSAVPQHISSNAHWQHDKDKDIETAPASLLHCILMLQFWNVEILLHFNFTFSQCSSGIYRAFGG